MLFAIQILSMTINNYEPTTIWFKTYIYILACSPIFKIKMNGHLFDINIIYNILETFKGLIMYG